MRKKANSVGNFVYKIWLMGIFETKLKVVSSTCFVDLNFFGI